MNYDAPGSVEAFVHRAGRTGRRARVARGERAGDAADGSDETHAYDEQTHTFLCPSARADAKVAVELVATLRANGFDIPSAVAAFARAPHAGLAATR